MSPNISDIQTESTSPAKGLCCSMMFLLQYDDVCSFSRLCVYLILMTSAVSMYYADVSIVNMEIYSIVY